MLKNISSFLKLIVLLLLQGSFFYFKAYSFESDERHISHWTIGTQKKSSSIESLSLKFDKIKYFPKVALIDTGIDIDHPFLKSSFIFKKNANLIIGENFSENKSSGIQDEHGHGTHLAGIMKSVFPEISIIPLKYYSKNDSKGSNLKGTIEALKFAVDQHVDIINYSGGGKKPSQEEEEILRKANKQGILIIVAAGNDGKDLDQDHDRYYPASYKLPLMIAVTAHDQNGQHLNFANYGPKTVHISAPGEEILSILPNQKFGQMTGTSQATAFTTAVAAMLKSQFPKLGSYEIKEIILNSAERSKQFKGKIASEGILKATKSYQLAKEYSNDLQIMARSKNE